jgi:hypothetical protein
MAVALTAIQRQGQLSTVRPCRSIVNDARHNKIPRPQIRTAEESQDLLFLCSIEDESPLGELRVPRHLGAETSAVAKFSLIKQADTDDIPQPVCSVTAVLQDADLIRSKAPDHQ